MNRPHLRALPRLAAAPLLALLAGCAVEQTPLPDRGLAEPTRDMLPPLDRDPRPTPDLAPPEPDQAPPDPDLGPPDLGAPDLGPPDLDPPEPDLAPPEPDLGPPEPDMAPPITHPWLIIVDDSRDENRGGTAGIDICGATADCGDRPLTALDVRFVPGDGRVCDGVPDPPCGDTARDDPRAALDDGAACEPGSAPSDYVSTGIGGVLALDFGADLAGCRVEIVEFAGADLEPYDVFVCRTERVAAATCLGGGPPTARAPNGGPMSVDVPAP